MTNAEKRQMAQHLRAEAEEIRRHGLTNCFQHTYACIRYGQTPKGRAEDRCTACPLRPWVSPEFQEEAFACQHITPEGWQMAIDSPGLTDRIIASFLRDAAQLEAEADGNNCQRAEV